MLEKSKQDAEKQPLNNVMKFVVGGGREGGAGGILLMFKLRIVFD